MEAKKFLQEYGVHVTRDGRISVGAKEPKPFVFNDYWAVRIGKNKRVFVHRLVALAFCDKPDGCDVVDHVDGNKKNNKPENLEWVTPAENVRRYHEMRYRVLELRDDPDVQEPALETLLAGLSEVFNEFPDLSGIPDEELAA